MAYPRVLLSFMAIIVIQNQAFANAPVFDAANFAENLAIKTQQIQSYKTQIEQYQLQMQNAKSLDVHTWDDASTTMKQLVTSIDTLDEYKQQAGSLQGYLDSYQSTSHYQQLPCFKEGGCTAAQLQALERQQARASQAQKRANDAQFRGIDKQQASLKQDAARLKTLQSQSQTAQGQMQALQAANQLASAETNQLLQIRGVLVAAQNAEATRLAAVSNKEAMQEAADAHFRAGRFVKSTPRSW